MSKFVDFEDLCVCMRVCLRVYIYICVFVLFFQRRLGKNVFAHRKMLCDARPLLAIPTKSPPADHLSRTSPRLSTPPAKTAIRHFFSRGSLRLYSPLHCLALDPAASYCFISFSFFFSSFFFSSNAIEFVHHTCGETNLSIPSFL